VRQVAWEGKGSCEQPMTRSNAALRERSLLRNWRRIAPVSIEGVSHSNPAPFPLDSHPDVGVSRSNSTPFPLDSHPNGGVSRSNFTPFPLGSHPNGGVSRSNFTPFPLPSHPNGGVSRSNFTPFPLDSYPIAEGSRLTEGYRCLRLRASLEETDTRGGVGAEGATAPESLRQKDRDTKHLESGAMARPPTG
jgi:hypothetical protein